MGTKRNGCHRCGQANNGGGFLKNHGLDAGKSIVRGRSQNHDLVVKRQNAPSHVTLQFLGLEYWARIYGRYTGLGSTYLLAGGGARIR